MKRQQFTTIDEVREAHLILSAGVLIGERRDRYYKIKLYQIASGYLEVFFHEHFNVIIKANHFNDPLYLDPYLSDIDISAALC
jgi:hypothetical protein